MQEAIIREVAAWLGQRQPASDSTAQVKTPGITIAPRAGPPTSVSIREKRLRGGPNARQEQAYVCPCAFLQRAFISMSSSVAVMPAPLLQAFGASEKE
jgi:hypothetical protein